MSRNRSTSKPILFHKHTKVYYVTRNGKRGYWGFDEVRAIVKYHRVGPGFEPFHQKVTLTEITINELASRFILVQQINLWDPSRCYVG